MYVKIQMKEMRPLACWLAVSPQAASDKTGATGLTTAPHEPRPPTAPFILPVCPSELEVKNYIKHTEAFYSFCGCLSGKRTVDSLYCTIAISDFNIIKEKKTCIKYTKLKLQKISIEICRIQAELSSLEVCFY
jgi:hypothetical protein